MLDELIRNLEVIFSSQLLSGLAAFITILTAVSGLIRYALRLRQERSLIKKSTSRAEEADAGRRRPAQELESYRVAKIRHRNLLAPDRNHSRREKAWRILLACAAPILLTVTVRILGADDFESKALHLRTASIIPPFLLLFIFVSWLHSLSGLKTKDRSFLSMDRWHMLEITIEPLKGCLGIVLMFALIVAFAATALTLR